MRAGQSSVEISDISGEPTDIYPLFLTIVIAKSPRAAFAAMLSSGKLFKIFPCVLSTKLRYPLSPSIIAMTRLMETDRFVTQTHRCTPLWVMLRYTRNAAVNAPKQKLIKPNPANKLGRMMVNTCDRSISGSFLSAEHRVCQEKGGDERETK